MTGLAVLAVYYRFSLQHASESQLPLAEMACTALLTAGSAVGMELWARWAHRALWHGSMWELDPHLQFPFTRAIWDLHKSHHKPREGAFEANDVFAVINAVPATSLCAYGFFHSGLLADLAFGAGLGITLYGIAYMFVHDGADSMPISHVYHEAHALFVLFCAGLVHRRFPVGPISDVPYFKRLKAAHKIHHNDTFNGSPFGLFLAEQELREVGGLGELEAMLERDKKKNTAGSA